MSAPRQTQPIPTIILTPPDEERGVEQSRQPFFPQPLVHRLQPAGPRPIQPCPVTNETVIRPRATTELVRPMATRPTARMTLPMLAMSQQGNHNVPQKAIAARFAGLGDARDVERAVAELSRRGAYISEELMVRYVETYKTQRLRNESKWTKQLTEVDQGTYGLNRVAHPTAKDITRQAAQQRYDADQAALTQYAAELRARSSR